MNVKDKIYNRTATLVDQKEALQDPLCAYLFARYVTGADIEKCQEVACRDAYYAYAFARYIEGANIEKCQEAACKDTEEAYYFARWVPGANMQKSLDACKGTIWKDKLNELLMNKALL